MPSLHMLGHMVAMAVIATLVKQMMELNAEVNKLKDQLEDIRETPGCNKEASDNDMEEADKADKEVHASEKTDRDESEKECEKNKSVERESVTGLFSSTGQKSQQFPSVYSSVWCHEGDNQMCQFENICYNSKTEEFVLFRHESSTLENVNMEDGSITVDLSSLRDHNVLQTTVVSLPSEKFSNFEITWINKTTLVFKPFLTDNLMHVLHDDIIPLHHTLKLISTGVQTETEQDSYNVQLFIFDSDLDMDDEIKKFYEVFSKFRIKTKEDFQSDGRLVCFRSVYIGLSQSTTWYDYGFSKPQGPLLNSRANGFHIKSTSNFLLQHLEVSQAINSQEDYLVLFTRIENRKILNEHELLLHVMRNVGLKVITLNFESYSISELIAYIRNSKGIIAMHGSLLILSMFLKPGSIVIELFPYAVNPTNYTPYKTLSGLNGMGLTYKAWTNQIKENSIGHPDWSPDFGGLMQLESDYREVILQQKDVPPHKCCKDPSWLYHIYQDTVVNASEVSDLAKVALAESQDKLKTEKYSGLKFHPSKIQNVLCHKLQNSGKQSKTENSRNTLRLQWDIPWTTSHISIDRLHYEVLVQDVNTDRIESFQTRVNQGSVGVSFQGGCYVWVRGVINDILTGPYSQATLCHTDME